MALKIKARPSGCDRILFASRMKLNKPVTICTNCGAPGYHIGLASGKCGRMIGRKRCKGTNQSAIGEKDWAECPSCTATGQKGDKTCRQCDGSGWLYVRR
jgi:DnaJ-class molecular chaperone